MNNLNYREIIQLRNLCDRILDEAGRPKEVALQALLRNQICIFSIKLGILAQFFRTYRKLRNKNSKT